MASQCSDMFLNVIHFENPVSYTNKTHRHDIIEILLEMALSTIATTKTR
jgi:hypothetical protein